MTIKDQNRDFAGFSCYQTSLLRFFNAFSLFTWMSACVAPDIMEIFDCCLVLRREPVTRERGKWKDTFLDIN
jgi:hypothetical protein